MDEAHRSGCPINLTLEVVGDRWSLILIRDLMFGNRRHFWIRSHGFNIVRHWHLCNLALGKAGIIR